MVIVVAAVLSFVSMALKPAQDKNVETEKKMNILASINIESTVDDAEELFKTYITETYIIKSDGSTTSELTDSRGKKITAFDIDLKEELAKKPEDMNLPLFVSKQDDGKSNYIIPVRGKGLWGPIWGYIGLSDDLNTIFGVNFDHKSETPGLGAEINTKVFQKQFFNKTLFDDQGNFVSVNILKGGALPDDMHGVDAISGGTITSKALEKTIRECIGYYQNYFKNQKNIQ
jgi:Na+-transporting NADH:ubiquinone oxidoreductase subunit C